MIDDDGLWRHEQGVQPLRDLGELHPLGFKDLREKDRGGEKRLQIGTFSAIKTLQLDVPFAYLLEVLVTDNKLSLVGVLELVCFNVLPQCLDDHWTCLGMDAQEPSQPRV